MSHLPECGVSFACGVCGNLSNTRCICRQLRACEQRVLDAAREAVAALVRYDHNNYALVCQPDGWAIDRDEALAAIDRLREEEK